MKLLHFEEVTGMQTPKWLRFGLVFAHVIDQLTNSAQADRRYAHTLFSLKDRSLNMIQAGGDELRSDM